MYILHKAGTDMKRSKEVILEAHMIAIMALDKQIQELQDGTSIDLLSNNDSGPSLKPKEMKDKAEEAITDLLGSDAYTAIDEAMSNSGSLLDISDTIMSADDPLYRARANMIANGRAIAYARAFYDLGNRAKSISLAAPAATALGTLTVVAGTPGLAVAGALVGLMYHKALANTARQFSNLKNYQSMDRLIEQRQAHVKAAKEIAGEINQSKEPLLKSLGRSFRVLMKSTKTGSAMALSLSAGGKPEDFLLDKSDIDLVTLLSKQNEDINAINQNILGNKFPSYASFDNNGKVSIRYAEPIENNENMKMVSSDETTSFSTTF
jgi:hypothetical protein